MSQTATAPAPRATAPARKAGELRMAAALARKEVRSMLRSRTFLAMFLLSPLLGWPAETVPTGTVMAIAAGFRSAIAAVVALVYYNLAALRPRRHGAEESFAATPAPPRVRTAGLLLSLGGLFALASLIPLAMMAYGYLVLGGYGAPQVSEMAAVPLTVTLAGALGVLVAGIVKSPLAGVLAGFVLVPFRAIVDSAISTRWDLRWLGLTVASADTSPEIGAPRPSEAHALYLLALIGVVAVAALMRHGRTRQLTAALLACAVAAGALGYWQVRPRPQAWADAAELSFGASGPRVCRDLGGFRYCALPRHSALIPRWAAAVEGALAQAPPSARPARMDVMQRATRYELRYVNPRVLAILEEGMPALPGAPAAHPGAEQVGLEWDLRGRDDFRLALAAASRAVGLPASPLGPGLLCDAAGQARAAVALWLAAQGGAASSGFENAAAEWLFEMGGEVFLLGARPGSELELTTVPVAFGSHEVALARSMLRKPGAAGVLASEWARFTQPSTSSAELARAFGVPLPGPVKANWTPWSPDEASPAAGLSVGQACG